MEAIETTYQPLATDEKAYFFFPNSKVGSMQKRKKKQKKARKAVDFSTTDKFNMTITKRKKSESSMTTLTRTRSSTTESSLMSKGYFFSCNPMDTNQRTPLNQWRVILNSEKSTFLQTSPRLKPLSYNFFKTEKRLLLPCWPRQKLQTYFSIQRNSFRP